MIGLNLLQPRGVTTPKNKDAFHHKETRKLIWNHFDIGLWAWWLVVHHYVKNIDGIIIPVLCLSLIVDLWVVKKWYVVCCPLAMAVSWVWSLHRISPPLFKSHIILLMAINSIIIIFSAVVQVVFFVSGGGFYLFIVVIWSGLKKIRIANRWCVVRWSKFFGSKPRDSLDTAITTDRFAPWK